MNLETVLDALAAKIRTAIDRVDAATPEHVNPPCAFLGAPQGAYDQTFDGAVTITVPVWVILGAQDMKRAQLALSPYISTEGDKSIPLAVNGDLGGADSVRATGWDPPGLVTVGANSYTGARINVEVYA